jgi:hypothetical protein
MNNITKSQTTLIRSARTYMFMCALLYCSIVSFGQLKVNPKTIVTANNVVSSKEEVNVFDSSVLGNDALFLNGVHQYLETADSTSLPSLHVANGNELTIRTELTLRGNLVVKSGVLVLQKPLHIKGDVFLEKDAAIQNQYLIIYENKFVFQKEGTSSTVVEMAPSSLIWMENVGKKGLRYSYISLKPVIISNDFIKSQYLTRPFSPPPEKRVHAQIKIKITYFKNKITTFLS